MVQRSYASLHGHLRAEACAPRRPLRPTTAKRGPTGQTGDEGHGPLELLDGRIYLFVETGFLADETFSSRWTGGRARGWRVSALPCTIRIISRLLFSMRNFIEMVSRVLLVCCDLLCTRS